MDNLFADCCRALHFKSLLARAGITKRSGLEVSNVVYLLLSGCF